MAIAQVRRTQEERSAEMRERILRSALDCITLNGLQRTSTHDIARIAEISRGALLHHFPTRATLLEAAYSTLLEEEISLIDTFSKQLTRDGSAIKQLVEFIHGRYSGPLFKVTLDYLSLARVDQEIMAAVVPGSREYVERLNLLWDKCLEDVAINSARKRSLMNQTLFLIRGMSFQGIWRQDDPYFNDILSGWTDQLIAQLSSED